MRLVLPARAPLARALRAAKKVNAAPLSVLRNLAALIMTPYLAALDRRRHHRRRPDQAKPTSASAPIARAPSFPPGICEQQFQQKEMSTSANSRSAAQPAGAGRSASELAGIGACLARAREGGKHDQRCRN
jgi:hypothetical protein